MDSSDLTKFRRNRVASNSHNGQKATRPANKITQMSSGLLMDLIMGSRKVVNGNTTILPNCGGTNGAGCNQDLIDDEILEPPNNYYPYWAASVLTDRAFFRPTSIAMASTPTQQYVFAVDAYAPDPANPAPANKLMSRILYTPSASTQIAPTGNVTGSTLNNQYYKFGAGFTPGTIIPYTYNTFPLGGQTRILTFDYFDGTQQVRNKNSLNPLNTGFTVTPGIYMISIAIDSTNTNQNSATDLVNSTVIVYTNITLPGILKGSPMATVGQTVYYVKDPSNTTSCTILATDEPSGTPPQNFMTNVTVKTFNNGVGNNVEIMGMRATDLDNNLYLADQGDGTIKRINLAASQAYPIHIIAGLPNTSGIAPAYPSTVPIDAGLALFDPSDIEVVSDSTGVTIGLYIADQRGSRVLYMNLTNNDGTAGNTVKIFAGCEIYPNISTTINGNFNNPAQFNTPPPVNIPALGETPPPPTNGPTYTLVPANSANLVLPTCLCKVPSAPILTSVGPTQILVGTYNTYAPPVTAATYGHLPLMLVKYYY